MLKDQFNKDLEEAKEGEQIVAKMLASAGYEIKDVSEDPAYYHKGDLLITSTTGEKKFIEIKTDSRIADTGNILLEEGVYYKENDRYVKGYMYSDYDIYAVVSKSENLIYFFDFNKLKEIYKKYGVYKRINHPAQYSDCYLLELCRAKQFGALIAKVKYQEEENKMERIEYNTKLAQLLQFEMEQLMRSMEQSIEEKEETAND